jgi:xanthine dehydrogenase accessory factor
VPFETSLETLGLRNPCAPLIAATGAAYDVLTHSHSLDSLIVSALLERGDRLADQAYFEHAPEDRFAALVWPIGDRGVEDKRPEVIAALVAAIVKMFAKAPKDADVGTEAA